VQALAAAFKGAYPAHPALNRINALLPLTVGLARGDRCGEVRPVGAQDLFLHPGATTPTSITLDLGGHYRQFHARAAFDNRAELLRRPATQGEVRLRIEADGRTLLDRVVSVRDEPVAVRLEVDGVRRLTIAVECGRHGPEGDWFILGDARME
jgi:hypothetical protein